MSFLRALATIAWIALAGYLAALYFQPLLHLDLFLLYAVYSGLSRGQLDAEWRGFAAGLTQDLLGHSPVRALGVNGFSKTLLSFLVATVNRYLVLDSVWLRMLAVLCASLLNSLTVGGLLYILGQPLPAGFLQAAGTQAPLNALASVPVFRLADRLARGAARQLAKPYAD